MSAQVFERDTFYECRSNLVFRKKDVEYGNQYVLLRSHIVLCEDIVFRNGGEGRGYYAKLRHRSAVGHEVVVYHRVSKNRIGRGDWEEANPMVVLALADQLPTN